VAEASRDQKQRLPGVLFPSGITYDGGAFGTAGTSLPFTMLDAIAAPKDDEASLTLPSWNQLLAWLRETDLLRRGEAA
jgi:hypothetical protein